MTQHTFQAATVEDYGVSVAVTFGYRARDIAAKPRRPLAEIVRWAE